MRSICGLALGLAACFPTGHTYTANTLDSHQGSFHAGVGMGVAPQEKEPGDDSLTVVPLITSIDLGYEHGLTDSLTVGGKAQVGFLTGGEAAFRLRFLQAGSLSLALNGAASGLISLGGNGESLTSAYGRLLWTVGPPDGFAVTGSGNLGLWEFADPALIYGFSIGLQVPQSDLVGLGVGMLTVEWGVGGTMPVLVFGYGLHIGL